MPRLTQTLDVQGQSISLHDEAGRITAAQALRLLDAQGVALLLTTPNFLWTADLRSVGAQIEQLGVYLDAALLIRRGAFEPATHLPGLLVILKREKPDRVFVGELDAETARNGILLHNLLSRKRGKVPQLGSLVERPNLTSVEAVFTEYEIKRQVHKMDVDSIPLVDVHQLEPAALWVGVDVERRRKPPPLRSEQEAVVAQVVVAVADQHVEDDAQPELAQVGVGLGAVAHQHLRDLQVRGAGTEVGAVLLAGERHGRCEVHAAASGIAAKVGLGGGGYCVPRYGSRSGSSKAAMPL